jgi:hypothetical protein
MKIGFSYPKKFKIGAYLISWWINRPYSHCYIMIPIDSVGVNTVYQAAHGSVHFREYDTKFKAENHVVYEYDIEISKEQKKAILKKCIELAGDDYGYAELPMILASDICHYLKLPVLQTKDGPGYICSELVGAIMIDILGYTTDIPRHLLKPNDIENLVLYGKN